MPFTVIGIYKAPSMSLHEMKKELSHTVIDFKINVDKSNTLCDCMENT